MKTAKDQKIIDELESYVAGRGRDDNFMYSKTYSPKSFILCVDFSPWLRQYVILKDIHALGVFKSLTSKFFSFSVKAKIDKSSQQEASKEIFANDSDLPFDQKMEIFTRKTKIILKFPFDQYFQSNTGYAEADVDFKVALFLGYPESQMSKIMIPYDQKIKRDKHYAKIYMERYPNKTKSKDLLFTINNLQNLLPKERDFHFFQDELKKLPLATRLHVFDIHKYSTFGKKPKLRLISDMTLYDTRSVGIDRYESAMILQRSKLITYYQDGTGSINSKFWNYVEIANEYSEKISPIYYGLQRDINHYIYDEDIKLRLEEIDKMED